MPDKVYRTAIYCRLSREDGDKVESNSIASQRAICDDYRNRLEVQGLPHYIRRRSQMKVFLYIRVACADQLAATNQREELERYAKDKGFEVAAAVAADGISGVHTEGIMDFLLNEAKRQGIGTILTRDTSRISRDTSSFMRFERKFRENGIQFEYLSKPDNELPVTPMMEAFETAYKKRRTKNGKRA